MFSDISRLLFVALAAVVYAGLWLFADNILLQFLTQKSNALAPWSGGVLREWGAPFSLSVASLLIQGGVYAFLCANLPKPVVKNRSRFYQFFFGLLPFVLAHILFLAFFNNFFIYVVFVVVYATLLALFAFVLQLLEAALRLEPAPAPFLNFRFMPVALSGFGYGGLLLIKIGLVNKYFYDGAGDIVKDFSVMLYSPQFNEALFPALPIMQALSLFAIANGLIGAGINYFYARAYAAAHIGTSARLWLFSTLFAFLSVGELVFYFGLPDPNAFFLFCGGVAVNFLLAFVFFIILEIYDPTGDSDRDRVIDVDF